MAESAVNSFILSKKMMKFDDTIKETLGIVLIVLLGLVLVFIVYFYGK